MNVHVPNNRLASVRLDLEQRRRALAANSSIVATRCLPEANALLQARRARLALEAVRRLAKSLPGARVWNDVMRRDVGAVRRALAAAGHGAARGTTARARAEALRDRLSELEAQELRTRTLEQLVRRSPSDLFPSTPASRRRR